ncbi:ABC transporter ATP-binding protein [Marinicella rhabdoformis]|uniref:ABC transporter ATP-binding protein n=1 Tax=Marinicella rhabdoformis TaxID=2580566 RepID=UPI0012AED246|nr:ABC transporter ATP-binding protein [Marinicella rhabdoformis]
MSTILSAQNVNKRFKKFQALKNVNLTVNKGKIVGLIGPNGAGKTTLLKAVLGLDSCDGDLKVMGLDPFKQRANLMKEICFIADVAVLPKWIKVSEALRFTELAHPNFSIEKAKDFLSRTKVNMDHKVKELSKGMTAQLHLAIVMSIDAKLLVLDEPTLGLDILFRKEFYDNLLNDYFDNERTIIITTHQVEEIEHILTDIVFIREGEIVLNANMEELTSQYFEVMVNSENYQAALSQKPLTERKVFGKHIMLFHSESRDYLETLGEVQRPSVSDLFVALMQEEQA